MKVGLGGVVSLGSPREFIQAEKQEQEIAEGCKRLIKNCIICWNYLYLSQKIAEADNQASRDTLLEAIASGSVVSWQHVNLLGEYDFSEEKLQDTVGIKPPRFAGILNRSDERSEGSPVFVSKPA